MSIMTRMVRLWKADVHGVMDQFEDKSLLLNQHLREMETALDDKKALLKRLKASRDKTAADAGRYEKEIERLDTDIDAAVEKERDDIARFLIKKIKPLSVHQENLKRHRDGLDREIDELRECLEEQRLQYERIQLKAKEYLRKSEQVQWERDFPDTGPSDASREPCKEGIELELLRRKEKRKEGVK